MTSQSTFNDRRICKLLQELSDEDVDTSDNKIEDNLHEEVCSDTEYEEVPLHTASSRELEVGTESSCYKTSDHINRPQGETLRGKNGHIWATNKGRQIGKTSATNFIGSRGPSRINKNLFDPFSCFNIFVTPEILNEITKWTNEEIQLKTHKSDVKATHKPTTMEEIQALIGILTLSAAIKNNHLSTDELFDTSYSGNRYVAAMSRDRFDFLIQCLRMDDKNLRQQKEDTLAPIRNVWEIFTDNCRSNYIPGPNVTIDEQLLDFRGKCPFRVEIPNKSNKYGIKIPLMYDSVTKYMIDAIPYLGKCTETNGLPLSEFCVKKLTKTIHGSNRNVTVDNRYTSVPLAKSLLAQPYNLTLVGSMKSNKGEIPEELNDMRSRAIGTSMFCYDGPLTLVSYKSKASKMVYVLSSRDEEGELNPTTSKPKMIHFYNETKGDTFDQICAITSCSRKTNKWPMAMFYGILNMAFINSYVVYCHNVLRKQEKQLSRRDFMKELGNSLMATWMTTRHNMPTLSRNLKNKISDILPMRSASDSAQEVMPLPRKRKYCAFCPSKIKRMTKSFCNKCNNPICGEHKCSTCPNCIKDYV